MYHAADAASNTTQNHLLTCYKANSLLLICGAVASLASTTRSIAIISAVLFGGSLLVYVFGQVSDFQGNWYKLRALAESIKTATWRLAMAAEPFASPNADDNLRRFRELLRELLAQHTAQGTHLAGKGGAMDQISQDLVNTIGLSFEEKRALYLAGRIDNQLNWYNAKSRFNSVRSSIFLWLTILAYAIAIVLILVRIANPETAFLPIDVFAVLASSLIGWTQIKRFSELASAYALTAHEVGIIKSKYGDVVDARSLSDFVSDAENAFSREHTQWAARRDH